MKTKSPFHLWIEKHSAAFIFLLIFLCGVCSIRPVGAQTITGKERDRGREILEIIKKSLEEYYYDPAFHGMDLNARFKTADERIKKATSNSEIFSIIAQVLIELNDSHTYFLPPDRLYHVDYGWQMQMIGDKCYVVAIKPDSDAKTKGLKVGDEVWSIDGYEPTRENLWKIKYSYYMLKPRAGMSLVLQDQDGTHRELALRAKLTEAKDFFTKKSEPELAKFQELSSDLIIWKMRSFSIQEKEVDEAMKRILPFKSLILDLRGNGGGYETTLLRLLGYFFDHDVKLGDIQRRKGTKLLVAKTRGERSFKGQLVVLVDSDSASAAELFSRTIQLEKRGIVIGDQSSGRVMRSILHGEATTRGVPDYMSFTPFAVSVTDADITMIDGKSLEGVGVRPDELLLPTREDLRAARDPVLSRAAAFLGVKLDPRKAGTLFGPKDVNEVASDEDDQNDKDKK